MKYLFYLLKQVCFLILLSLITLLSVGVFLRYIVGSPIAWSTEATSLLLAWLSFLGLAVTAAERRHMLMDLLRNKWKGKFKTVIELVLSAIIIAASVYVIYYGVEISEFNASLTSEELQISYAYFYAAIPVGFFFYLLFEIQHVIGVLRGRGEQVIAGQSFDL